MSTSKMLRTKVSLHVLLLFLYSAQAEINNSSLTFVIDDTNSMHNEINSVKDCTNEIFDAVMNSGTSQIDDVILVTFNDPDFNLLIKTRSKEDFKEKLANIHVHGGGDCPEMAMAGIKLALEESKPGSLLYVFTDASAKDYNKQKEVTSLAQAKSIQVVFVLTGECGDGKEEVYYQVATATGGQVFNLGRTEVPAKPNNHLSPKKHLMVLQIIELVKIQARSRLQTVAINYFPAGTNQLQFQADSKMKEVVISVSGKDPTLKVTDPVGKIAPTEEVATRNSFAIVKIKGTRPGVYTAEVKSTSRNTVIIKAETNVQFEHGFSTFVPSSIQDTVTRPIPGEYSYLSIKLPPGDFILDAMQILNLDGKVSVEMPLKLINEMDQFYITTTTFVPPNSMFRVAVKGHDTTANEIISRVSLTPIEPQSAESSITNKKPTVTLIESSKINAEYNKGLLLRCKVSGHPKPEVIWQKDNDNELLDSTLNLVEYPDNYLSTLSLNQVVSNDTYYCIAKNEHGEDSKKIDVETRKSNGGSTSAAMVLPLTISLIFIFIRFCK